MKNNIVVITNLCDGYQAIGVENFSDENVKIAISKVVRTGKSNLKLQTSSMCGGIYKIKRKYPHLTDNILLIDFQKKNKSLESEMLLDVRYCKLLEA